MTLELRLCELNYRQDQAGDIACFLRAHVAKNGSTIEDIQTLFLHYLFAVRPGTGNSHEQAMQAMKDCNLSNPRYRLDEYLDAHKQILNAMDRFLKVQQNNN